MVYDFIPYVGKILPVARSGIPDLGASANSVLQLAECIPEGRHYKLYFDNWFTSVKLVEHLATRKIWACGTVQERRLAGLKFIDDKQLRKLNRGAFDEHETQAGSSAITAVKWNDSRSVCLLSSFVTSHPVTEVRRFDKKKREYTNISIPNIVSTYNKHMGGVDLHDQMMSYYRMSFRSKKYYLRLIFHMLDMAVVNSWLLRRRVEKKLNTPYRHLTSLCEFKLNLADSLMFVGQDVVKKRGRPTEETVQSDFAKKKASGHASKPIPSQSLRKDGVGHLPEINEKRGMCKLPKCTGRIHMYCMKCQVHLCCEKTRNCFAKFHLG
jgi:hypothetical protein